MNKKLTERVTVEQEVTGVIRDLVLFVHYLRENSHGCPRGAGLGNPEPFERRELNHDHQ